MRDVNTNREGLISLENNKSGPNTIDKNGDMPLHLRLRLAVRSAEPDVVKKLLDAGAYSNAQDKDGATALHTAVETGALPVIQILLRHAATDLNARLCDGATPLILASRLSMHAIAEALISAGADVKAKDNAGKTALHWAASFNNVEAVSMLIEFGAIVDAKDKKGQTPLHDAARSRSSDAIKMLLDAGADANAEDMGGRTPLHSAVESPAEPAIPLTLLRHAATNLNARTLKGTTPLILAIRLGKKQVAEDLISAGADTNATDHGGKTALHWATTGGRNNGTSISSTERPKIVQMLLDAGVDVNVQDKRGRTALYLSVETPVSVSITKMLLAHPKIDLKARMDDGTTPLMSSTSYACPSVIFGLIKAGIDINAADNNGNSALHWAAYRCNVIATDILLRNGANPDVLNDEGQTPLHCAANIGFPMICSILLERFANRDIRDNMGKTPRDIAQEREHPEIVLLLQERMPAA